jgi:hypothetical protein
MDNNEDLLEQVKILEDELEDYITEVCGGDIVDRIERSIASNMTLKAASREEPRDAS